MATIVMHDGRENIVSDEQARAIWVLKQGFRHPTSKKQEAFVRQVREVIFDGNTSEPPKRSAPRLPADWRNPGIQDKEMRDKTRSILANQKLNGREKARKIAALIKKRHEVRGKS